MKLIPQNEVNKAAFKHAREFVEFDEDSSITEKDLIDYAKFDFKSGVEFAESKFQELAIEFVKYSARYGLYHIIHTDGKESFKQFIRERNGK